MSFTQENGYLPVTIQTILNSIMENINVQFNTSYTSETFVGSNHYKFAYSLAQRIQGGEVKTSEIFLKLQQYIAITNERISRPVNTNPGIVEKFSAYRSPLVPDGLVAAVKPMIEADAGKIHICVDADDGDRAEGNFEITAYANLVSGTADVISVAGVNFTAQAAAVTPGAGTFQAASSNAATATSLASQINAHATTSPLVKAVVSGAKVLLTAKHGGTAGNAIALGYTDNGSIGATKSGATLTGGTDNADYDDLKAEICTLISQITVGGAVTQGTESESIVLSNGQSFDFKFNLPDRKATKLRLTITLSENNQVVILSPDEIKENLLANINARYRLGRNFEPQRYFSVVDAPWAAQVVLEYSLNDGATYATSVYDATYLELFDIGLADIELVEV